jgi:uncharacterized protein
MQEMGWLDSNRTEGYAMKAHTKRIFVLIAGWSFLLLGIVGLILPFLQGVLFILVGLIILSSQYAWARRLLVKLRERFPKTSRVSHEVAANATVWLKRISPDAMSIDDRLLVIEEIDSPVPIAVSVGKQASSVVDPAGCPVCQEQVSAGHPACFRKVDLAKWAWFDRVTSVGLGWVGPHPVGSGFQAGLISPMIHPDVSA